MYKIVFFLLILVFSLLGLSAQETRWLIGDNGLMALCDKDGNPVTGYDYELINDLHENLAAVRKDGKWGFIDALGNVVIKCKYREVFHFSQGLCPVTKNFTEWFFINKSGKKAFKEKFQYAMPFSNGLAPVKKDGLWGFINSDAEFVIPAFYESANVFSEGLAPIRKKGLWGYVNTSGRLAIPFIFEQANPFVDGKARVNKDGTWYHIDKTGKNLGKIETQDRIEKVYKLADKMPVFPGGYNALFDYMKNNLQYPDLEKSKEITGVVRVSFLVDTVGHIQNIKIVRGLTANCDVEAMRLLKSMPKWEPGIIDDKKVNVQLLLDIPFKIDEN